MRVTVDPLELMTMAVALGTSAVEVADVGTSLHSCVDCSMPPDIRHKVDQIVATIDTVLDTSASVLRAEAADLAQRSLIATNDSLAAASLATAPTPVSTVGGSHFGAVTITNIDGSPAAPMPSVATVGGSAVGSPVMVPSTVLTDVSTVGGSWTPGLAITLVNPDGTPSTMSTADLDAMLRRSSAQPGPRTPTGSGLANQIAVNDAINRFNHATMSDIAYAEYATQMTQMGRTPLERHQKP